MRIINNFGSKKYIYILGTFYYLVCYTFARLSYYPKGLSNDS